MKKALALTLALALAVCLTAPVLAADTEETQTPPLVLAPNPPADWPDGVQADSGIALIDGLPQPEDAMYIPIPHHFVGEVTVNGTALDLSGIPGAPSGYLPMRAICEAMDAYVSWENEIGTAVFLVDGHDIEVNLADLTVRLDFEPVEDTTAYFDPAGYTYLPAAFLDSFQHVRVDVLPELSSVHYDIDSNVFSDEERVANAILEAAQASAMLQLDETTLTDHYGFHMDIYDALAAYQPMMSAQPTTVIIAAVKEGQMDAAKADMQAYLDAVKPTLGFYPATAEAIERAQVVESGDGVHLMLVATWESNDQAVELFQQAFPAP